jgi:hypothetical protein
MMHPSDEAVLAETRRQFFGRGAKGLGSLALLSLLAENAKAEKQAVGGLPGLPHFAPKAKRAIYLHMLGAPPQMETFDYASPLLHACSSLGSTGRVALGCQSCCRTRRRWWMT